MKFLIKRVFNKNFIKRIKLNISHLLKCIMITLKFGIYNEIQ